MRGDRLVLLALLALAVPALSHADVGDSVVTLGTLCDGDGLFLAVMLLDEAVGGVPGSPAIVRASVSGAGVEADAFSYDAKISGDGRFVAFTSFSNKLADDSGATSEIYLRDLAAHATIRASKPVGDGPGVASSAASISADGRFIAYQTNRASDISVNVYDRVLDATEPVSALETAFTPSLSADGRFVAFMEEVMISESAAQDRFAVRDRTGGGLGRFSPDPGYDAEAITLDCDGGEIAYEVRADSMIPPNRVYSAGPGGAGPVPLDATVDAMPATLGTFDPGISADGRLAVFSSKDANLVAGDTNGFTDVFVRDLVAGATERVSVATDGAEGDGASFAGSISADGRFVAFASSATNLGPAPLSAGTNIFVRDRRLGTTRLVSALPGGAGAGGCDDPSISAGGRFIAFVSSSAELVPMDTNATTDVFVRDMERAP